MMTELMRLRWSEHGIGINARYTVARGRLILSAEYRAWRDSLAWRYAAALRGSQVTGAVAVHLRVGSPADIDAYVKV